MMSYHTGGVWGESHCSSDIREQSACLGGGATRTTGHGGRGGQVRRERVNLKTPRVNVFFIIVDIAENKTFMSFRESLCADICFPLDSPHAPL